MASVIKAWSAFGPKLLRPAPVTAETVIEQLVQFTGQSRGSILAVLAELEVVIEQGLKEGRIVQLPNGMHCRPNGRRDGSIGVTVRMTPRVVRQVNAEFRGCWANPHHIGIDQDEVIALWNAAHPEDPVDERC